MAEARRLHLPLTIRQGLCLCLGLAVALQLPSIWQPAGLCLLGCGWLLRWKDFSILWVIAASVIILSVRTVPAFTVHENYAGRIISVSSGSFLLQTADQKLQVISKTPVILDSEVIVQGAGQPIEAQPSFYGFRTERWAAQNHLAGKVFADHVEMTNASHSLRGGIQQYIENHFQGEDQALMKKLILNLNDSELPFELLLQSGLHYSLLLGGLERLLRLCCQPQIAQRFRQGLLAGLMVILRGPYPLLRLMTGEISRFVCRGNRREAFVVHWLMLILAAPARVSSAAFLFPFCFSVLTMTQGTKKNRLQRFILSFILQGRLFHTVSFGLLLGMGPLRRGLALACGLSWLALLCPDLTAGVRLIVKFLDWISKLGGQWPGQPSMLILLWLAGVMQIFPKRCRTGLLAGGLCLISIFGLWHPFASLTVIDVGQGDSLLLRLPFNRGNILIDTGRPAAWTQVSAMLQGEGVKQLDALILTHADEDHSGNRLEIMDRYHPKQVIDGTAEELQIAGLTLYNLNPEAGQSEDANRGSLVLLTEIQGLRLLVTGDAPADIEYQILNRWPGLRADLVKLGHHGSRTSSSERWLAAVKPQLALNSSGRHNRYGHPHAEVTQRLKGLRIPMLDTQDQGDIRIVFTPFCNFLFTAEHQFAIIGEVIR